MAYEDSDWALKTNERGIAKNIPLLGEYANYGDWETESKIRPMMLYNRPKISGVDYFVNNLGVGKTAKIDVDAGGSLKHKASSKIADSEKAILRSESYEPIGYDWAFGSFKSKYQEPYGAPIVRRTRQLGAVERR